MKAIALDTNAYRALDDGHPVVAKLVQQTVDIGLPIIVLGELYFGFENGRRKEANVQNLQKFLDNTRVQILQLTPETTRIFGEIATELERLGKRIQQDDIWIAALAKQYGYTLVTADKGFEHIVGLDIIAF
jgi:predicted nucleic acid-binding protein